MTIDEAFTYLYFVSKPFNAVWVPGSNNHVLNTLLMGLTTRAFGTSNITVRGPALLGAVLYVVVCYFLCKNITSRFSLRLPLFICLTYNPFILDFMVAARGYSLADAFLLTGIAVPVWHEVSDRPSLLTCCGLASLAMGLSFTANFSFGFIDCVTFLAIAVWAVGQRKRESISQVLRFCALPGLFVSLLFCGYPLAHWPKGELWWGAHSLKEMTQSLVEATLYHMNPRFGGSLYKVMRLIHPLLLPALGILCVCQLMVKQLDGSWSDCANDDAHSRWRGKFGVALAGVAALAVVIHWLAFRFAMLLLPLGRTGIFLVPLCTLTAGIIAAAPARSLVSQWLRRAITGVILCLAFYFILCLRLSYFKEYQWDADVKDVYSVLAQCNRSYGVTDVGATALYITSLNYYRVLSKRETFPKFELEDPELSPGKSVYVMSGVAWREFIDKEKLAIVYRGKSSDVVVAVLPDGPIPPIMIRP